MKLDHVLASTLKLDAELGYLPSDELKRAARFWLGKEAASYNKDACLAALARAMKGNDFARRVETALSEREREVLGIFTRYGDTVPGGVLTAELRARGLAPPKDNGTGYSYAWRANDFIGGLSEKLVLLGGYDRYYSSYSNRAYPQLSLHPALVEAVKPAPPLSWNPSQACDEPVKIERRSSAEVALDLWRVAAALRARGNWATVKGDLPSKATRTRMRKELGLRDAEKDPLSPPDPESLFYELLRGMGFIDFNSQPSWIREEALSRYLAQPPARQAWHSVRAWLGMALWQDGIGAVPDRDSHSDFVRIEPQKLSHARKLLAWALSRVAHASIGWLDLEVFLRDLWQATRESPIDFYSDNFTWDPSFEMARKKDNYSDRANRELAFWLDDEAVWASNALMVTLFTLGLVERGQTGGRKGRPCFRLTELGQVVFGAPEIEAAEKPEKARFLTVQPNLEVVAYLESADAPQISKLCRFALCAPGASGPVQTFALRRESLYAALESGMTLDEVCGFLSEYGRSELPANVKRMLSEWAGKRESLVLRKKVALALGPAEDQPRARALGGNIYVLPSVSPKTAAKSFEGWTILDHEGEPERTWTTDELGNLATNGGHSILQMRLARIADPVPTGWQVTQESIRRARMSGLSADQILAWLGAHLTAKIPALLEVAVRNWTGRQGVRLSQAQLLRIVQPRAKEALLHSPTFRPLLAGHIPPEWFLIREEHLSRVRTLLEGLGFTIGDQLDPPPLEAAASPAKDHMLTD
jgi:Helicase conserved C-terminal domain